MDNRRPKDEATTTPLKETSESASTETEVATEASTETSASTEICILTDRDVLCGRGKYFRRHPGNELFNKLLRAHYDEYKAVPKGRKILIVKKIVSLVREGQAGGKGRFLERTQQKKVHPKEHLQTAPVANNTTDGSDNSNQNENGNANDNDNDKTSTWSYIDIGDERAINKTAQALRDIKVTMEKLHSNSIFQKKIIAMRTTSEEKRNSAATSNYFDSRSVLKVAATTPKTTATATGQHRTKGGTHGGDDGVNGNDGHQHQQQQIPRRPTFRERLAMLERQQQQRYNQSNDDEDEDDEEENDTSDEDDSSEESDEEDPPPTARELVQSLPPNVRLGKRLQREREEALRAQEEEK